jgi:cell division septation protein DedD
MHTHYNIPRESSAEPVKIPAPAVERPVVISPAPVRAKAPSVTDASRTAATPAAIAPAKGSYVIQVVTYPARQDADKIVASFKKAGIHAYVKENSRPSGRLFYLVLIRGGRTEEEAKAQLLKFRANEAARPFRDAFVKSSRS